MSVWLRIFSKMAFTLELPEIRLGRTKAFRFIRDNLENWRHGYSMEQAL
jgi:hypothetical protein